MTGRDRRALMMGAAVVGVAVLLLRVLPWGLRNVAAARSDLLQKVELLARAEAEVDRVPALGDSAAFVRERLVALAPSILSGDTAAEAAADLAGRVNLAAARHAVKLERTDQIADSARAGALRAARVRATLECDIRGLVAFLRALDRETAVLTVRQVRVQAPNPLASSAAAEVLQVEVTVSGWYLARRREGS